MFTQNKRMIVAIILILLASAFYYFYFNRSIEKTTGASETTEFKDTKYNFSFLYPKTFTISKFSNPDGNDIILVEDFKKNDGFQITITPFDNTDNVLTIDRIHQDIPDLIIRDSQPVLVGNYGKGLAFTSNNSNYGGNSREVWFVYDGYLYQISTYAHLDSLLQPVLSTWKFLN